MKKFNNNLEDIVLNAEYGNKTFWQLMGRFMGKIIHIRLFLL